MSETVSSIAQTRPRIRRDVLFTRTADGVLFHTTQGGFSVNSGSAYQFAALIVPHLDGESTVDELCEALPEGQRKMVRSLVKALLERGFARDAAVRDRPEALPEAVRTQFAAQVSYVDHFQDGPSERFATFRDSSVVVLGDDLVSRWCALSLVRNGLARVTVSPGQDEALADVIAEAERLTALGAPSEVAFLGADESPVADFVVCTGKDAPSLVVGLLRAGLPANTRLLSAVDVGGRTVVGPLMSDERAGCWACAALRLGANLDGAELADVWAGTAMPELAAEIALPGKNLAAMLGNLLGYEIFRLATGAMSGETEGRVVVQDHQSLDTASERLLPHPRCPFCAGSTKQELAGVVPTAPVERTADNTPDAEALLAELDRRTNALVGPRTGVFTRFDDDVLTQSPLKASRVVLGFNATTRRTITAFDLHNTAGARLRALRSAIGVYTDHVVPAPETSEPGRAVPSARLATASGIPAADPAWVPAVSLVTGDEAHVPVAAVRPFGIANQTKAILPTSAGIGVGDSLGEAVHEGLFSALCHDAVLRAVRGAEVHRLPLSTEDTDAELRFLARSADNLDVPVSLLDLGDNVVLATAGEQGWTVAADTTRRAAAVTALRDLVGLVQLRQEFPDDEVDTGDPIVKGFDPAALLASPDPAPAATPRTAVEVLDRLRAQGRDALAIALTSADVATAELAVVRVVLTS